MDKCWRRRARQAWGMWDEDSKIVSVACIGLIQLCARKITMRGKIALLLDLRSLVEEDVSGIRRIPMLVLVKSLFQIFFHNR